MVVSFYSPVSPDASPSREAHTAGDSVFPEVCVYPVDVPPQRSLSVLDDGSPRWFGAGGLAVRPPPSGQTSAPAAQWSRASRRETAEGAVRRFFHNVWNDGDVSQTKEFIADGFVSHNTLDVAILGPDEYGQAVTTYRTAFPDLVTTVEDVFVAGDRIAVRGTDRGTHMGQFMGRAATGRKITSTWIEIFRIENGKAVEGWLETDARASLERARPA